MKFAICNELFEGWAFDRVCRFIKDTGYEGLEVAPFTLAPRITDVTPARRVELRRQAADAGVEIIGLHWLLARTEGYHLTSPDVSVRQRTAAYVVALAEACRDLGGSIMVFGSPMQRSFPPEVAAADAFRWAADAFREAMPAVAACGVTICMEPLTTAETNFITTCAEGAALVETVGHPQFVLHLDVKAMSSEPTPVPELIERYAGQAGHFHVNDTNLKGPGFGSVDYVPIVAALKSVGYDGYVSVEVFKFDEGPEAIATRSLEYLKRVFA